MQTKTAGHPTWESLLKQNPQVGGGEAGNTRIPRHSHSVGTGWGLRICISRSSWVELLVWSTTLTALQVWFNLMDLGQNPGERKGNTEDLSPLIFHQSKLMHSIAGQGDRDISKEWEFSRPTERLPCLCMRGRGAGGGGGVGRQLHIHTKDDLILS